MAISARAKPLANRRFLLVTLPSGPFARRLARQLRGAGADVLRVILNGGDLVSWGLADGLWPRVPRPLWRSWLDWQFFERSITDVVVFGDTMAFSAEALAVARQNGVGTWVLENGYNRPDWVTLEPTGVNAYSCMPRDPGAYGDVDISVHPPEMPHVGLITPFHTLNITSYFTGVVLGAPIFPAYRYPYAVPLWPQIFGHIRRYCARLVRQSAWERQALDVMADPRPFFLSCLQRDGDSQLLEHSELKTNTAFMAHVIASFAAGGPGGMPAGLQKPPPRPQASKISKADAWRSRASIRSPIGSSSWKAVFSLIWRARRKVWSPSTRRPHTPRWASACRSNFWVGPCSTSKA